MGSSRKHPSRITPVLLRGDGTHPPLSHRLSWSLDYAPILKFPAFNNLHIYMILGPESSIVRHCADPSSQILGPRWVLHTSSNTYQNLSHVKVLIITSGKYTALDYYRISTIIFPPYSDLSNFLRPFKGSWSFFGSKDTLRMPCGTIQKKKTPQLGEFPATIGPLVQYNICHLVRLLSPS